MLTRSLHVRRTIFDTFNAGKKVMICGNGGSAADSQHIAAEFVGRYEAETNGVPGDRLTTDTSALTALANDYDFDRVFARQVEALASDGDCLIAISTSGNSPNIIAAVMEARRKGCKVIGLTGAKGKKLASLVRRRHSRAVRADGPHSGSSYHDRAHLVRDDRRAGWPRANNEPHSRQICGQKSPCGRRHHARPLLVGRCQPHLARSAGPDRQTERNKPRRRRSG